MKYHGDCPLLILENVINWNENEEFNIETEVTIYPLPFIFYNFVNFPLFNFRQEFSDECPPPPHTHTSKNDATCLVEIGMLVNFHCVTVKKRPTWTCLSYSKSAIVIRTNFKWVLLFIIPEFCRMMSERWILYKWINGILRCIVHHKLFEPIRCMYLVHAITIKKNLCIVWFLFAAASVSFHFIFIYTIYSWAQVQLIY